MKFSLRKESTSQNLAPERGRFSGQSSSARILIILLILAGAVGALLFQLSHAKNGTTAYLYQDGILIREVDLSDVSKPYTFSIESPDGGYNEIAVEPGKIGVSATDCPDKICQHMGMVSSTAFPISCLPHKLIIQIVNPNKAIANEPDAFAH